MDLNSLESYFICRLSVDHIFCRRHILNSISISSESGFFFSSLWYSVSVFRGQVYGTWCLQGRQKTNKEFWNDVFYLVHCSGVNKSINSTKNEQDRKIINRTFFRIRRVRGSKIITNSFSLFSILFMKLSHPNSIEN